ncbi:urea ABC transporter ATP-binding protein UrtD [Cohnella zeiphila]|uniref:Urea ABC transporter ATP-binding protein UrtD n=1 Tax=Cohnella zeiphila TaxID=2761120 RepID=A0A7X0VTF3_9BACL|nr:urea ABC transporter ATP-binding protein UrtD [Cohnella zeiphila]MBB6729876.1 urea ABC transporter ATP-binding protein UrtD [Cohnella zeiphila]
MPWPAEEVVLSLEKITVEFDGFRAVNGMDLSLRKNEVHFLIGPNGAGKTTMLDVMCGKARPASGRILFRDRIDLSKKKEHQIAQLGIGRKFQAPSIFSELTVEENLALSLQKKKGVFSVLFARRKEEDARAIERMLSTIGLGEVSGRRAGGLSHGQKQWLEIGMLLIQEPAVVLLDEPVAGMTDAETEKTGELLRRISVDRCVLVVEHDMEFVRQFAGKVTIMHEGKLLMEGTMDEVQADARVAEVYLGKRRDADVVGAPA